MKIKEHEENAHLLFCAFRYALGRKTYIVSVVVDRILDNWDNIPESDKTSIKREIKEAEKGFIGLGHDMDKKEWYKILNKEQ